MNKCLAEYPCRKRAELKRPDIATPQKLLLDAIAATSALGVILAPDNDQLTLDPFR